MLILQQFERVLNRLSDDIDWRQLEASGYLDYLTPTEAAEPQNLTPTFLRMVWLLARHPGGALIANTMAARLFDIKELAVSDLEANLQNHSQGMLVCDLVRSALLTGYVREIQSLTLSYAQTRQQFKQPISKFQTVQHQLATLAEETIAASIACEAAFSTSLRAISADRVSATKFRTLTSARKAAAVGHALHGAMGISAEYPLGRLVRAIHDASAIAGGIEVAAIDLGMSALSTKVSTLEFVRSI